MPAMVDHNEYTPFVNNISIYDTTRVEMCLDTIIKKWFVHSLIASKIKETEPKIIRRANGNLYGSGWYDNVILRCSPVI
jgi:hypothetical protein